MKSLIVAAALAFSVVAGSLIYTSQIDGVSKEMSAINADIRYCLEKREYERALEKIDKLKAYLDKKNTLMAAMGDHEELDRIRSSLSELEIYTEEREKTQALSKCAVLEFLFEHLAEGYHVKIENIL